MSIERAIIARSRSYAVGVRATEILSREALKGCDLQFSANPVKLEPAFVPCSHWSQIAEFTDDFFVPASPGSAAELSRVHCLISPEHKLEWSRAERFLKQLCGVSHRVGFEIRGNRDGIKVGFLVDKNDAALLKVALEGEFPDTLARPATNETHFKPNICFYDFFPLAPYHHLQTQPQQLQSSLYDSFIRAISQLPGKTQGFVQVLFEPARHYWHPNVERLTDIEFTGKSMADPHLPYRTVTLPSGELKNMAMEVETKAHYDKPFYFVALRAGVRTPEISFNAWPLTAFAGLIHRGGQPLQYLTEKDYLSRFNSTEIAEMFYQGLTYRPGFLVNSAELASLVHLPCIQKFVEEGLPVESLEKLSLPRRHHHLITGIEIGDAWYGGSKQRVCINDTLRKTSLHIIGRPGTGKTTTMEHMVRQDVERGHGLAFIDPHGDSVKRLLQFIPKNRVESTIYLDFGDPDWVPLWNPLQRVPLQSIGRTADGLVAAIKSVVQKNAWGDRLEHILRNGFSGLLHLEGSTFFDLITLFENSKGKNREEKNRLKKRILAAVDNQVLRLFWERDYEQYRRDDFAPPLHKLSKLLSSDETVSLMLTQPENRLDLHDIMETGKILLLDLSNLGPDTRGILGCFLLAFLYNAALFRSKKDPDSRKSFSIYCDEAHKLTTGTLEDMIAECRKFGVNLTLAHQFLSQFKDSQRDALTGVGTRIIFNVDIADANYLVKDLQKKVEAKDLATLKRGEAIAKIDTDILKIRTPVPKAIPQPNFRDEIIAKSHERYCREANEIREYLRKKQNRLSPESDLYESLNIENSEITEKPGPVSYDEFD